MAMIKHDFEVSGDVISVRTPSREPVSRVFFDGDYPTECLELCAADEACAAVVTYRPMFSAEMCRFHSAGAELVPRAGHTSYLMLPASPPPAALALALPELELPKLELPNVTLPELSLPDISFENISLPELSLPDLSLPQQVVRLELPEVPGLPGGSSALVLGFAVALLAAATALIVLALRCRGAASTAARTAAAAELWQSIVDPESGETYFWNTQTGEASWSAPAGWEPPAAGEVVASDPTAAAAPAASAVAGTAVHWERRIDPESGEEYFWNTQTGEASWSAPTGWEATVSTAPAAAPASSHEHVTPMAAPPAPPTPPAQAKAAVAVAPPPASRRQVIKLDWSDDGGNGGSGGSGSGGSGSGVSGSGSGASAASPSSLDLSTPGEYAIGREVGSSVTLDHESCSRRHARLTVAPSSASDGARGGAGGGVLTVTITDLGSLGGTFVSSSGRGGAPGPDPTPPLPPHTPTPLADGAELFFARSRCRYRLRIDDAVVLPPGRVWIAGTASGMGGPPPAPPPPPSAGAGRFGAAPARGRKQGALELV